MNWNKTTLSEFLIATSNKVNYAHLQAQNKINLNFKFLFKFNLYALNLILLCKIAIIVICDL